MKKSLLASLATLALAFSGVVSGVAPASAAVYNVDDSIRDISVQRVGDTRVDGENIVAATTLFENEVLADFGYVAEFASVGSPLVLTAGQALTSVIEMTNTTANQVLTGNAGYFSVRWTKTDNTTGNYYGGGGSVTPVGTFKSFEVEASRYVQSAVLGNYTVSANFKIDGVVKAPISLIAGLYRTNGFRIDWLGGMSYTPNTLDSKYNAYSKACFWQGDYTITANTVLNVSYDNLDPLTNAGFAAGNNVEVRGATGAQNGYWNPQDTEANEVFSISLAALSADIDAVSISAYANIETLTANSIRPVFKAWLDNNTSVNVLDSCNRFESFAAPTLTPATATTATLSWSAPATAHSADWDTVRVYACLETRVNCGTSFAYPWDVAPGAASTYDFELMSMGGPITGTQATISANSMMDAAMMMGPSSGTRLRWTTSGSYKYFVVYSNMNSSDGYKGLSIASAAVTAGGVASTPSTPSTPNVSATVARNEPVLKGFAGHSVAKLTQKTFALDASGLTGTPEVLINGKKLTYVKDAMGMMAIELPKSLKRGGTYDLVVSSPEGTVTVLGAIVVSADLPITKNTPTAFKGTSIDLNAAQVRNIRALVNASQVGDTVTCTAYVSGATTDEVAKARAINACAAATAVNPELKTVIRTAPAIFSVRNKVRVVIG